MTCKARQYSDQMMCDKCALQWDVNDPEPPLCKNDRDLDVEEGVKVFAKLKVLLAAF